MTLSARNERRIAKRAERRGRWLDHLHGLRQQAKMPKCPECNSNVTVTRPLLELWCDDCNVTIAEPMKLWLK